MLVRSIPIRALGLFAVLLSVGLFTAGRVCGQSLLSRLKWQRTIEMSEEYFARNGRALKPLAMEALGVRSDSIRGWLASFLPEKDDSPAEAPDGFPLSAVKAIAFEDLEEYRPVFERTEWAFLGNTTLTPIDTMITREIRARMEYHFGPPTLTLMDQNLMDKRDSTESIQFEYWFLLNESIPVYVLDVNGPWDRGVVIAAPSSYRSILAEIKDSLLRQLIRSGERKPYADYYYNVQQELWYVTAFDGASFFDVRIDRPVAEPARPNLQSYVRAGTRPQ